jgi:hypothetical protein
MLDPVVAVKLWVPIGMKSDVLPIEALAEINIALPHTFIQEGVATSLGLEPSGILTITTATKPKYETHLFKLRVVFPKQVAFEVEAVEIPYMLRPGARIKCLIGRDILQHTILRYDGPSNEFSLVFKG